MRAVFSGAANEQANTSAKVLFTFSPQSEKREVTAIVLLPLKTLGWFIVNERNRTTSTANYCTRRIKAYVPFWDHIFLREGHNTSYLQQHGTCSTNSVLG